MKNIHLILTDKLSKLGRFIDTNNLFIRTFNDIPRGENVNIYITSDEEIKEGDWCILLENHYVNSGIGKYNTEKAIGYGLHNTEFFKKIILTTDQSLDGVQAIDDEFLEWFVHNPSCEEVKIESWQTKGEWDLDYKTIIPKEEPTEEAKQRAANYMSLKGALEPKQETLEEASKDYIENTMKFSFNSLETKTQANRMLKCAEFGAKWQKERMYNEEDMMKAYYQGHKSGIGSEESLTFKDWFEQFEKK